MSRRGTPNRRVSLVWDMLGGLSRSRARRALALDALDVLDALATGARLDGAGARLGGATRLKLPLVAREPGTSGADAE